MPNITFGLTLQPTAPKPDAGKSAAAALRELMTDNERFVAAMQLPFDTVWVEDHLQWGDRPMIECWSALTYLLSQYPQLKFGHIVMGQSYRNPALTVKMASVLHALSGGRLILGLGAGWKEDEYRAYGYDYPSVNVRLEQLEDTCHIVRTMLTDSPATYHGKHYSIENAYNEPRPETPLPLMLGGGGEKTTLRLVAQYADWWNNEPFKDVVHYAQKQAVLKDWCAKVGRDFAEIKQTYYGYLQVTDDPSMVQQREELHIIAGAPARIADELRQFIALGVTHFMFRFADFPKLDSFNRFVAEVLPQLDLGVGK